MDPMHRATGVCEFKLQVTCRAILADELQLTFFANPLDCSLIFARQPVEQTRVGSDETHLRAFAERNPVSVNSNHVALLSLATTATHVLRLCPEPVCCLSFRFLRCFAAGGLAGLGNDPLRLLAGILGQAVVNVGSAAAGTSCRRFGRSVVGPIIVLAASLQDCHRTLPLV
jgi:hypothetical protein